MKKRVQFHTGLFTIFDDQDEITVSRTVDNALNSFECRDLKITVSELKPYNHVVNPTCDVLLIVTSIEEVE